MKNKFDFYEIVKVESEEINHNSLNGKLVVIRGMVHHEQTGEWIYGVSLKGDGGNGMLRRVVESKLKYTGDKIDPSVFKTNTAIRVQVDPKTGEGNIVEEE